MEWIPLAIALAIFVTSCVGLGYIAGCRARGRKWLIALSSVAIGCLWPVFLIAYVIYTGNRYIAAHPGEVNDAPPMVLMGVIYLSPFIFVIGLALAVTGSLLAKRRRYGLTLR